jgi:glycosyltransferase XagB
MAARPRSIDPLTTLWWAEFMSKRAREAHVRRLARVEKLSDPSDFAIKRAARAARLDLSQTAPHLSSSLPAGRVMVAILIILTLLTAIGAFGWMDFKPLYIGFVVLFALLSVMRVLACFLSSTPKPIPDKAETTDIEPMWSILIALNDEVDSVGPLLEGLSGLDWAKDKLDIIFACEQDDEPTLTALKSQRDIHSFRIVRVPAGGPRTKPNALQTALPFARGRFISVYDAEDQPDPSQLRAAFHAFATGPSNLAVVQAPLVTWNHTESWIAKQFALDYAVWFRVILPALTRLTGISPLGGTSNHFRRDALLISGGWDPYNVTEDADLGIRLGRMGYQAAMIDPPTFEEAPPRLSAWVKQRGRWIQGHIQTVSVHLRTPVSLSTSLGPRGLLGFLVGLAIGPMSALFIIPVIVSLFASLQTDSTLIIRPIFLAGIVFSTTSHFIVSFVGVRRDGRIRLLSAFVTLPIYFALQCVSACRAMWRVVFTPSFWDKTAHGHAARKGVLPKV